MTRVLPIGFLDFPRSGLLCEKFGQISGWIAEDRADSTPAIFVNGSAVADITLHSRPDVEQKNPTQNVLGFSTWVEWGEFIIRDANSLVIDLQIDGLTIDRRYCRLAPNLLKDKGNPLAYFIHIPKTAGTAIRNVLETNTDIRQLYIYPDGVRMSEQRYERLACDATTEIDLVYGHFSFGMHRGKLRPFYYVTILRDPYEYLVSQFYYSRLVTNTHQEGTPALLLNQELSLEYDNLFTRLIAGNVDSAERVTQDHLSRALQNLEHFRYIGFTDRMSETLEGLSRVLGIELPLALPLLNETPDTPIRKLLDHRAMRTKLLAHYYFDLALYREAQNLFFGMIPASLRTQSEDNHTLPSKPLSSREHKCNT